MHVAAVGLADAAGGEAAAERDAVKGNVHVPHNRRPD